MRTKETFLTAKNLLAALAVLGAMLPLARATTVTFGLGADDYGTLTINGRLICSYNDISAAGGANGSFDMTPGIWYDISIDYENRAGSDGLSLAWDQPGPKSIGYGSGANVSAPNLVPLASLRTTDGAQTVPGLTGNYFDLDGTYVETEIGEGPIDAINNVYNNEAVGSWAGFGYFSLFEEQLSGQICLNPITAPTANGQSLVTTVNSPVDVTLTGSDPNSPPLPLTYEVTSEPMNGALSGTAPDLTYTPNSGFTGTDSFQFTVNNGSLASDPGTVSITVTGTGFSWSNPSSIIYGSPLTPIQLNASADVPGTFDYDPAQGVVLDSGVNTLSVIFTPTDLQDYDAVTDTVSLTVSFAPLKVSAANTNRLYGAANPPFSGAIGVLVNGDDISLNYVCAAASSSPVGSYPIIPSLVDPDNRQTNYLITTLNGSLLVNPAPLTITAASATRIEGAANPVFTGTISGLVNGDNITASYSTTAAAGSPPGAYPIMPSLVDPNDIATNYNVSFVAGTLTITAPTTPEIASQPASETVIVGGATALTVGAAGAPPLTYQWQENGTNLADSGEFSGATNATLTINPVSLADAGSYSVIVSNSYNTVTSSPAVLAVQTNYALFNGLAAYYQFEGNGLDSFTNHLDLTLFGSPGFASGLFGQSLDLHHDAGQYAQRLVDDSLFDFGTNDFSIQLWVNFYTFGDYEQTMLEKFQGSSGPGWTLSSPGEFQFYTSGAAVLNGSEPVVTNVWHQLVVRRDGATFELYFDDTNLASTASAGAISQATSGLLVGKRNAGDGRDFSLNGRLDEIAIWDRTLTDAEIQALYNGGQGMEMNPNPSIASATNSAPALSFAWNVIPGQTYQAQYTTNLTQPAWTNFGGPVLATGASLTVNDSATNTQRFYRLALQY